MILKLDYFFFMTIQLEKDSNGGIMSIIDNPCRDIKCVFRQEFTTQYGSLRMYQLYS